MAAACRGPLRNHGRFDGDLRSGGSDMRTKLTLALAAAAVLCAGVAAAADNEAGVPLSPGDAAGVWTLESGGQAICRVALSARATGAGFLATPDGGCGDALPAGVAGWAPTGDGMALTGAGGKVLLPFDRWSNSLFVAHIGSGRNVQLMRGAG